ncbi:hypothetical protein M422DRAFT_64194 [Sphaerobolus stellatus SS14]|nr:hypothetical protein M422DRAFT_64194 [Sphaerobolus stellatus SS14]
MSSGYPRNSASYDRPYPDDASQRSYQHQPPQQRGPPPQFADDASQRSYQQQQPQQRGPPQFADNRQTQFYPEDDPRQSFYNNAPPPPPQQQQPQQRGPPPQFADNRQTQFYPEDDPRQSFYNNAPPPVPQHDSRQHSPSSHAHHGPPSPQPQPRLLFDHSHLRPGDKASLLPQQITLQQYRENAKKTQDPSVLFEFAVFMLDHAKNWVLPTLTKSNVLLVESESEKRDQLIREATGLLKRAADRSHAPSQYLLADCYANGLGTVKGRQDFDRAYPLFVLAAKHNHADAAYRAGTCCENGWGCRRESGKAVQYYRKAAAMGHAGACYRLGVAELNGELGLNKSPREGISWLKRSAECATAEFPHALHELALLHEKGIPNVIFKDEDYAVELLAQAAELGNAPSAYKLGECYEYGRLGCPKDPALSIHYYNIAAQQNHPDACFALTAWYLVGSPGVLPQSDTESYLWAKKAADQGLAKAMYALGYFSEVGIGVPANLNDAIRYYKSAASLGDKRAMQRLKNQTAGPIPGGAGAMLDRGAGTVGGEGGKRDKDCVIM